MQMTKVKNEKNIIQKKVKNWKKLGLIYAPSGEHSWAQSHALLPTPYLLDDNRLRVYFASLDKHKFGRIGYVDLDAHNPLHILTISSVPVLDLGPLGAFDDSGVTPSCILAVNGELFLYYIGWQRTELVPYMLFTGLAVSRNRGNSFERIYPTPVLDRTSAEPYSRGAPFVKMTPEGQFVAYYWSCRHWSSHGGFLHYNNDIRRTKSKDGIHWNEEGIVCIQPNWSDEYSVGRPWIVENEEHFEMWYSSRSTSRPYRLGLAYSADGITWERKDENVGLMPSTTGWDSDMVCYPSVITLHGRTFMFYNGNNHGATGFGCAELYP